MTNFIFTNNAITTLASAATSSQTTLTLASSTNFPISIPSGCVLNLTLNDAATRQIFEICYVTAISGTTVTVTRGQEGTSAQNWSVGDYAFVGLTAGMETAMSYGNGQTYGADTGSANAYVVALTPTLTAHVAGLPIRVKIANTNTGASTLNPGPAAVAITYENGDALAGGELVAGGIYEFIYNGTSYLLANPTSISNTTVGLALTKVATPYTLQATDGGNYLQANASENFTCTLAAVLPQRARIMIGAVADYAVALVIPSGIYVIGESTIWSDTTLNMPATAGGEYIILSYVTPNIFIVESMTPATANALGIVGQTIQGGFKNLKGITTSTTARTWTADAITVESSAGLTARLTGVSVSYATGTTGANGYDGNGALGSSQWLYDYIIYDPTTATVAALCSHSATAPTLPSGYTHFARVGACYLDSSGDLMRVLQYGRRAQYVVTASTNTANMPLVASGSNGSITTPTWVGVSVAAVVPSTASQIRLVASTINGSNVEMMAAPNNAYGAYESSANPAYLVAAVGTNGGANNIVGDIVLESADIYVASNGGSLNCAGWEDNL